MKINDIIIEYIYDNKYKTLFWLCISILLYPINGVIIPKYYGLVINSFKDKKFFSDNIFYLIIYYIISMILGILGLYSTKLIIPSFGEYITTRFYNFIIDNYRLDFDNIQTGEIIARLVNMPQLFFEYVEIVRTMVLSQFFIFVTTLYHYWFVSTELFICFIISIIINYIFIYIIYTKKIYFDVKRQNSKGVLYQYINDTLLNLVSIYSFNQENNEKKDFKEVEYKKYKNEMNKCLNMYIYSSIFWNVICIIIFFSLNYYLYKSYKDNKISVKVLVSTFTITYSIFTVFEDSVAVSNKVSKIFGEVRSMEEYFNTIKINNKIKEDKKFVNGDIVFNKVYYKYKDKLILNNLNLKIKKGEHVLIVGETGSGKTTIVKLLMKYNKLIRGEITINNQSINSISYNELHDNIYYIPQNPKLFNRTLYKNIIYGIKNPPTRENILKLLKDLDLSDIKDSFSKSMDNKVGFYGNKLSGGQRQIVWLLRSFYRNKSIIILDEPTASLDSRNKQNMIKNIKKICVGKTLIVISHDNIGNDFRKINMNSSI